MTRYLINSILLLGLGAASAFAQEDSKTFERIFGIPRAIAPEMLEKVKALPAGERLLLDTDGDGVKDEVWYMDHAKRHTSEQLLVRVVDEDGDLEKTGRGDLDSDCYFWDHDADGTVDVVTDYVDDDGDGDVDQMGIFYDKKWPDEKDDFTVWWAVDIGDDNRLWYDVNGTYYQPLCQWRTHFSGDELFYQFRLTEDDTHWINVWEDPFAFYDPDKDGCSERVIRISAVGDAVKNLRYSIDADNDAYGRNTHNYDFSVTALPPEEGLSSSGWSDEGMTIRGIDTMPLLSWAKTPAFAQQANWGKAMLTWDEINSNTDEKPEQDPNERWEGILNHASKHGDFEQVGGPPSSAFNKRVEVTDSPASPLRLYHDKVDNRLHLLGADYGYMDVDYNLDGVADAAYTWTDTDGDGELDVRMADVDNDGTVDFEQKLGGNAEEFPLEFEPIFPRYNQLVQNGLAGGDSFVDGALAGLGQTPPDVQVILDYFAGPLREFHRETGIGQRIYDTHAGRRFYMDLICDRLFVHLRESQNTNPLWPDVEQAYLTGDLPSATKGARNLFALGERDTEQTMSLGGMTYESMGYIFRRSATSNVLGGCAAPPTELTQGSFGTIPGAAKVELTSLVATLHSQHLIPRVIPSQVDSWSFGDEDRMIILGDSTPLAGDCLDLFAAPHGAPPIAFPKRTNAVLDNPAYVAWESDMGAYRFYTGQFDFFGKHQGRLLPPEEKLIYPLIDVAYHEEQDWGIDALHVGTTSGLGGLTLYDGGKELPVQSPAGEGHVKFEYKVLGSGPVRAAVEMVATNVFPDHPEEPVIIRCFIYAGHQETEVNVILPECANGMDIAPGLMRLAEDTPFEGEGYLGTWGRQGDEIGEVGMAVILDRDTTSTTEDLDDERRLRMTPASNHVRYWIIGTWRRGMQYPIAPTAENWQQVVEQLKASLFAQEQELLVK